MTKKKKSSEPILETEWEVLLRAHLEQQNADASQPERKPLPEPLFDEPSLHGSSLHDPLPDGRTFTFQQNTYLLSIDPPRDSYSLPPFELACPYGLLRGKHPARYYLQTERWAGTLQVRLFLENGCDGEKEVQVLLYREGCPHPLASGDSRCPGLLAADDSRCSDFLADGDSRNADPLAADDFREGRPRPLADSDTRLEGRVCRELFLKLDSPLEPGRYFLCFPSARKEGPRGGVTSLESGCVYVFDVLEAGPVTGWLDNLRESEVELMWQQKASAHAWHLETLELMLAVELEHSSAVEITAICYAADFTRMAQVSTCRQHFRVPVFQLAPKLPWVPGSYVVVLVVNGYPARAVHFDIHSEGQFSEPRLEHLHPTDLLFKWVRCLEYAYPELGKQLSACQGLGAAKRKLLHLYTSRKRAERANHRRDSEGVVLISPDGEQATELAQALEPVWALGREEVHYIDCRELDRDWRGMDHDWRAWDLLMDEEERQNRTFVLSCPQVRLYRHAPLYNVLDRLFSAPDEGVTVVLCLSEGDWQKLQTDFPEVMSEIGAYKQIRIGMPSVQEKAAQVLEVIRESTLKMTRVVASEVVHFLWTNWERYPLDRWTDIQDWLYGTVRRNLKTRLGCEGRFDSRKYRVKEQDLQLEAYWKRKTFAVARSEEEVFEDRRAFEEAMQELNALVGLSSLKQGLNHLFTHFQFCRKRASLGLPNLKGTPRHLIFTGNPGTGKTTVAKLIGRIYKSLGMLSDGGTVVTERGKLVGRYIGQTEEMMQQLIGEAKGKVLFIDEAYTLFTDQVDRRDVGYRVIESLLTVLSDPDSDIVVILAGYAKEMQDLLQANSGLSSRFPVRYEFEDYSADELQQMVVRRLAQEQYSLTEAAQTALADLVNEAVAAKDETFGNGRWVSQLVEEQILPAMARRVMDCGPSEDPLLFCRVEEEDILASRGVLTSRKPQRKRMGFR